MLYFHRMEKNDIENKAQEDWFLLMKHVVAAVLVSLMEAVGVLVLLFLVWR